MIGGLLKSASRLALVAAAGVIVGGYAGFFATQAKAADLGGDCCADLEERVAELEATTARKGNRKVSLTVYGQVNEMVLFWDDGHMSDVYQGTNNTSRDRFGFQGSAKIDSDWSAGYRIEIGVRTAGIDGVSQFKDPKAKAPKTFYPGDDSASTGTDLRHAFWYIDSKTLGRLSVGQTDTPMSGAATVNLANIPHIDQGVDDWIGFFSLRSSDGSLDTTLSWLNLGSPISNTDSLVRRNEVMYTSPAFAGFQFQAAWGEADFWAVALQYAGEFSGFRLAAKVGYANMSDANTWGPTPGDVTKASGCQLSSVGSVTQHAEIDCQMWVASASIMHVPTGLFINGEYGELNDDTRTVTFGSGTDTTDSDWYVQGGLEQKFFPIGRTTLYGEYGVKQNGAIFPGYGGDTISWWGLGAVQSIDAAAMDLYIAYRDFSVEVPVDVLGYTPEDMREVGVGAIIKF